MPRSCRSSTRRAQRVDGRVGRPSGLARDLAREHRHQRALVRTHLAHQLEQIRPRIPFDVELDLAAPRREERRDLAHVAAADVALIGARMHGDAAARRRRGRRATASMTDGSAPPRELRSVAILLTLTESRGPESVGWVMKAPDHPRCCLTVSAISSRPALDLLLVLALDHDAQQRLGPRVADQQPPLPARRCSTRSITAATPAPTSDPGAP